ncbi:MAG: hydrolase [Bacillus sp. (in: firmicutes)]
MLRSFQYDEQWNIIYYPTKPSGFSVFIIGDHHHYVQKQDSYWLNHPSRFQLLKQLRKSGYTCFSSHLYGEHWGNDKAVQFAKDLYQIVMKAETLNEKIHLFAEGKGALVALKLFPLLQGCIRSVVLLNPCLSLKEKWALEKNHQIYFKPFLNEITKVFGDRTEQLEDIHTPINVPIKVIHVMGNDPKKQFLLYQDLRKRNSAETEIVYLLPEKRYKVISEAVRFFKQYETVL